MHAQGEEFTESHPKVNVSEGSDQMPPTAGERASQPGKGPRHATSKGKKAAKKRRIVKVRPTSISVLSPYETQIQLKGNAEEGGHDDNDV